MIQYLTTTKKLILDRFDEYRASLEADYGRINHWGPDSLGRLRDFVAGGKMIRGGLVRFTHDIYTGSKTQEALAAGLAMELFQAAFLIHDDIMDRDDTRRGKPSVHAQYTGLAARENIADAPHLGEALGICAGDLAIFLAFEILGRLELPAETRGRLLFRFSRELAYVGLAQMEDVYQGARDSRPSRDSILSLYTYKTGRYTFSLPFAAGLILAGRDEAVENLFLGLGEKMGILFQIKDDELGIWSNETELGKPIGSDLSENKKTLYREMLFERAKPEETEKLRKIYGSPAVGSEDLAYVRELLESRGVRKEVDAFTARLSDETSALIETLPGAGEDWKKKLRELLAYIWERKK